MVFSIIKRVLARSKLNYYTFLTIAKIKKTMCIVKYFSRVRAKNTHVTMYEQMT